MGLFGGLKDVATMVVGKEQSDKLEKAIKDKAEEGLNQVKNKIGADKIDSLVSAKDRALDELSARSNNLTYDEWMEYKRGCIDPNDPDFFVKMAEAEAELANNTVQDMIEKYQDMIEKSSNNDMKKVWETQIRFLECDSGTCPNCKKSTIVVTDKELINAFINNNTSDVNSVREEQWIYHYSCEDCGYSESFDKIIRRDV